MARQGIAHRDIKPENLFLTAEGICKLGDFGSAFDHNATEKQAGADGTPGYMSPEMTQCYLGNISRPDAYQSDVFSLGVTVLHLAALAEPFKLSSCFSTAEKLASAVNEALQDLTYSATFRDLLRRMLAMEPNQRPTVEEIAACLSGEAMSGAFVEVENVDNVEEALERATRACVHQQLAKAEHTLLQLLSAQRIQPKEQRYFQVLRMFACVYWLTERSSECKALVEEFIKDKEARLSVDEAMTLRFVLSTIYLSEYNLKAAESISRAALKLNGCSEVAVSIKLVLAMAELSQMKYDEAEERLTECMKICQQLGEKKITIQVLWQLGLLYTLSKRLSDAERVLLHCLEQSIHEYGEEDASTVKSYLSLAATLLSIEGRANDAEVYLQVSLDIMDRMQGEKYPYLLHAYQLMAEACAQQNRREEAQEWVQRCSACMDFLQEGHVLQSGQLFAQARACVDSGKWTEAENICEKALSLPNLLGVERAAYLQYMSMLRLLQGKADEARELSSVAASLGPQSPSADTANVIGALACTMQGRFADADKLLGQVQEEEPGLKHIVSQLGDIMSGRTSEIDLVKLDQSMRAGFGESTYMQLVQFIAERYS